MFYTDKVAGAKQFPQLHPTTAPSPIPSFKHTGHFPVLARLTDCTALEEPNLQRFAITINIKRRVWSQDDIRTPRAIVLCAETDFSR